MKERVGTTTTAAALAVIQGAERRGEGGGGGLGGSETKKTKKDDDDQEIDILSLTSEIERMRDALLSRDEDVDDLRRVHEEELQKMTVI